MKRWLFALFFLTSTLALGYELAYLNSLTLIYGSSLYAASATLAAFLLGLGLGSKLIQRLAPGNQMKLYAYTQLGIAVWGLLFIHLLNWMHLPYYLLAQHSFESYYLFHTGLFFMTLFLLLPPALCMGATFPLIGSLVVSPNQLGSGSGQLFLTQTLGNLAGSLLTGFFLLPFFGIEKTLILLSVLAGAIYLIIHFSFPISRMRLLIGSAGLVLVAFLLFLPSHLNPHHIGIYYKFSEYSNLTHYRENLQEQEKRINILFQTYTPYGSVIVSEDQPTYTKQLLINGKTDAGTGRDMPTQQLLAYLPLLLHPKPERIAIIGLGSGVTLASAALFPSIQHIDLYEINPGVLEAQLYFQEETGDALYDPRVHVHLGDARQELLLNKEEYDVIISEPSNPWMSGQGTLYTDTFYQLLQKKLHPQGLFIQWIGGYDYALTDFFTQLHTFQTYFPNTQVWTDIPNDLYLIGSAQKLDLNYQALQQKVQTLLIHQPSFEHLQSYRTTLANEDLVLSYFLTTAEKLKPYYDSSALNTDDLMLIEFNTLQHRFQEEPNSGIELFKLLETKPNQVLTFLPLTNLTETENNFTLLLHLNALAEIPPTFSTQTQYAVQYTLKTPKSIQIQVLKQAHIVPKESLNTDAAPLTLIANTLPNLELSKAQEILKTLEVTKFNQPSANLYLFETPLVKGKLQYCPSTHTALLSYYTHPANPGYATILQSIQCANP